MRLVLILLGMLLTQPAWAEWVELVRVDAKEGNSYTFYFDPASVRKTTDGRRAWVLYNYDTQRTTYKNDRYQSERRLKEFDCARGNERERTLQGTLFSDPMLKGLAVSEWSSTSWEFVPPSSVEETQLKLICKAPVQK